MPAPRECKNAKLVCELRREIVINMRRVTHPVQKQKRFSRAAPIQIVKSDTFDHDESALVRRLVGPIGLRIDLEGEHRRQQQPPKSDFLSDHARRFLMPTPISTTM